MLPAVQVVFAALRRLHLMGARHHDHCDEAVRKATKPAATSMIRI